MRRGDRLQCRDAVAAALDVGRIGGWPNDDKVIPCDLSACRAVTFIHELLFGLWIVNQQEIGIAPPRSVQALPVPWATT